MTKLVRDQELKLSRWGSLYHVYSVGQYFKDQHDEQYAILAFSSSFHGNAQAVDIYTAIIDLCNLRTKVVPGM